jgi:preprotein translocase subunit SecG
MANVLIVAYLLIVLALIAVILLQRSEGGGLGMGSSSTGLISVRGSANLLTRTTAILAMLFFATAIGLTILAELDRSTQSILEQAADPIDDGSGQPVVPTTVLDALNSLNAEAGSLDVPPATDTTTQPASDPALNVPAPAADTAPATDAPATDTTAAPATPAAATETPAATDPSLPVPDAAPSDAAPAETPAAPAN